MKYHIKKNGDIGVCSAQIRPCPIGGPESHFDNKEDAFQALEDRYGLSTDHQRDLFVEKKQKQEKFSTLEANDRARYVEELTSIALADGQSSMDQFFDKNYNMWTDERVELHEKLLSAMALKYSNVPKDGKVIISGGLPGAGKTTVLTRNLGLDLSETTPAYATISSDDFKEMIAEEGMVPEIDGLTPMEASTLVHLESSYLADELLNRMTQNKTNIIYDCTCKNVKSTQRRIGTFMNKGYKDKDIQLVFVDIPMNISHERAKYRYKEGLNNNRIGGRYVPPTTIDLCKPKNKKHNSKNAETILKLSADDKFEMPTPIVFDNSGDQPIQLNFNEFKGEK